MMEIHRRFCDPSTAYRESSDTRPPFSAYRFQTDPLGEAPTERTSLTSPAEATEHPELSWLPMPEVF